MFQKRSQFWKQTGKMFNIPCGIEPVWSRWIWRRLWLQRGQSRGELGARWMLFQDFFGVKKSQTLECLYIVDHCGLNIHWYCWWFRNPANSPVEVGSLSDYLQFFYIPGGCLGFLPSWTFQRLSSFFFFHMQLGVDCWPVANAGKPRSEVYHVPLVCYTLKIGTSAFLRGDTFFTCFFLLSC